MGKWSKHAQGRKHEGHMMMAAHLAGKANHLKKLGRPEEEIRAMAWNGWKELRACGCPPQAWPKLLRAIYEVLYQRQRA